ncbi:MAG: hypothetical protein AABW82_04840 [Nanoarchaeota archaeon]
MEYFKSKIVKDGEDYILSIPLEIVMKYSVNENSKCILKIDKGNLVAVILYN